MMTDTPTAITAMEMVIRAPNNSRENTSAPIRSVPNQWSADGGCNRSVKWNAVTSPG